MRTIYYKEAPENPESLKVLLKDYFEKHSPATYWLDTDEVQCSPNRHRSPDDLLLLANHYFPGTTIKEMMNIYKSISDDYNKSSNKTLLFCYCSTIKKPRLYYRLLNKDEYGVVNGIIYKDYIEHSGGESQWSFKELAEMIDD